LPLPDAARLKSAEAQVRDVYKPEYAKGDRRALASEFLRVALATSDDPAAGYFLFREANASPCRRGNSRRDGRNRRGRQALPGRRNRPEAFLPDGRGEVGVDAESSRFVAENALYLMQYAQWKENYAVADARSRRRRRRGRRRRTSRW